MNIFKRIAAAVLGDDYVSSYEVISNGLEGSNRCPCCKTNDAMMGGPEGGLSQNIMCKFCGTRLNITPMYSTMLIEWTHGPQDEIWGDFKQTKFPTAEEVENVKAIIEAR